MKKEKLHDRLNNWLKDNPDFQIDFNFTENNLSEKKSIKLMECICYIIYRKENPSKDEISLRADILIKVSDKSKKEKEGSGLKYEITPEMLEYKTYNKTWFKQKDGTYSTNIPGLLGLMQMN